MNSNCARRFALPRLGLVAFALAPGLVAQTFIVDAANGPGTNFTDLPPAVAAVPSGSTLRVRPGLYAQFQIANKSLRIIGEEPSSGAFPIISMSGTTASITIGPLAASQPVTISGLHVFTASPSPVRVTFDVTDALGAVVIEDVDTFTSILSESFLRITRSPNVHITGFTIAQGAGSASAPVDVRDSSVEFDRMSATATSGSLFAGNAMDLLRSNVTLIDSNITGAAAASQFVAFAGSGIIATSSTVHAFANPASGVSSGIRGGAGSLTGHGGHGMVLQSGSRARVLGLTLTPGTGFSPGQPFVIDATSTMDYQPTDVTPSGELVGVVAPGNTVNYTLVARPGSATVLLIGLDAQFLMLPGTLSLGALGMNPLAFLSAGVVPASGRIQVPSLVPSNYPSNTVVLAQFAVFDPGVAEVRTSNLFFATSRF